MLFTFGTSNHIFHLVGINESCKVFSIMCSTQVEYIYRWKMVVWWVSVVIEKTCVECLLPATV